MIEKRIIIVLMLILFSVYGAGAQPADEVKIDIMFTSSLNGNLDGCECIAVPRAGIVSSAVFLRERDTENSILLDLGDFMDVYPDDLLTDNILEVFKELKYDLLAVGDQEFTEGIEYFKGAGTRYPLFNNNMAVSGELLNESPVIIEKANRNIGFASIIDPRVFFFHQAAVKNELMIEDPVPASARLLRELENLAADLKILLFHGRSDQAESLFANENGWDIILYAHDQQLYQDSSGGRRYIASPGDNGNRVGIASIIFDEDGVSKIEGKFIYFDYMKDPRDPRVKRRIDLYKKEMIERLQGG